MYIYTSILRPYLFQYTPPLKLIYIYIYIYGYKHTHAMAIQLAERAGFNLQDTKNGT